MPSFIVVMLLYVNTKLSLINGVMLTTTFVQEDVCTEYDCAAYSLTLQIVGRMVYLYYVE